MAVSQSGNLDDCRKKGNEFYQRYVHSTNYQDQCYYLEKAIQFYSTAFSTASTNEERASSAKNLGTAAYRLISVLKCINVKQETIQIRRKEAVTYLSKALSYGELAAFSSDWTSKLKTVYSECISVIIEDLSDSNVKLEILNIDVIEYIEQIISSMCEDSEKLSCFSVLAEKSYSEAVKLVAEKDFKGALNWLNYCQRPAEECRRLSVIYKQKDMEVESRVRLSELEATFCAAEGMKDIYTGDRTLESAVKDSEQLNMDLVFDAIDLYKSACVKCREREVEVEAIALSRLGSLYSKFLIRKLRAEDYYMMSVQLAESMHPRVFTDDEWYKESTKFIQQIREERENRHDFLQRKDTRRQKYLEELSDDLREIKFSDIGENPIEFLRFLYEKYPPKNPNHKLTFDDCKEKTKQKKAITAALLHYHPDKQSEEEHGLKWIVFCSEITKRLNARLSNYKGCPTEEESEQGTEEEPKEEECEEEMEEKSEESEDISQEENESLGGTGEYNSSEENETDDDDEDGDVDDFFLNFLGFLRFLKEFAEDEENGHNGEESEENESNSEKKEQTDKSDDGAEKMEKRNERESEDAEGQTNLNKNMEKDTADDQDEDDDRVFPSLILLLLFLKKLWKRKLDENETEGEDGKEDDEKKVQEKMKSRADKNEGIEEKETGAEGGCGEKESNIEQGDKEADDISDSMKKEEGGSDDEDDGVEGLTRIGILFILYLKYVLKDKLTKNDEEEEDNDADDDGNEDDHDDEDDDEDDDGSPEQWEENEQDSEHEDQEDIEDDLFESAEEKIDTNDDYDDNESDDKEDDDTSEDDITDADIYQNDDDDDDDYEDVDDVPLVKRLRIFMNDDESSTQ